MRITCTALFFAVSISADGVIAQQADRETDRAAAPDWSQPHSVNVFFDDAFRDAFGDQWPPPSGNAVAVPESATHPNSGVSTATKRPFRWSRAVDNGLLIDEIKRVTLDLKNHTRSKSAFDRYGTDNARTDLLTMAVLFRALAEWDGESRFQADAAQISGYLRRQYAELTTTTALTVTRQASEQLREIVAGNRFAEGDDPSLVTWDEVIERSELMKRLERAIETHMEEGLQSPADMAAHTHDLCREANLATAIFAAMYRPGAVDADQLRYVNDCKSAGRQAILLRQAIASGHFEEAQESLASLRESCVKCHDQYR